MTEPEVVPCHYRGGREEEERVEINTKLVAALFKSKTQENRYIEISDSECSEIRTIFLQRTQFEAAQYFLPIVPVYFKPSKEETSLQRTKKTILKCPLFGDSTVTVNPSVNNTD